MTAQAPNPNTLALLDKAQALCMPPTAYRLAKETGIKQTTISRCRIHGKTLDDTNAAKLAAFLQMPVLDVIGYMNEDRAKTPEQKALWERMLPRVVPPLVVAIVAAGTVTLIALAFADVHASHIFETAGIGILNPLYIMRTLMVLALVAVVLTRAMPAPAKNPVTGMAIPRI